MKSGSDLIAQGLALSVAIITLALAVEVKRDVRADSLQRQPQKIALNDLRQKRNELKNDRKERRIGRRDRRDTTLTPK
jgi:hypothetical protein